MRIAIKDIYSPSIQLPDSVNFPHVVHGAGVFGLEYCSLDLHNEIHSPGPGNEACCIDEHLLHTTKKGTPRLGESESRRLPDSPIWGSHYHCHFPLM
jgi:hypothetical protein